MDAFRYHRWARDVAALSTVDVDGKPLKLTPTAKLVARALADHANATTGQCNPLQNTLAIDLAVSVRTIKDGLALLRRGHLIDVGHGRGNRAAYQLLPVPKGGISPFQAQPDGKDSAPQTGGIPPVQKGGTPPLPLLTPKLKCEKNYEDSSPGRPVDAKADRRPTQKQLSFIKALADECDVDRPEVRSRSEASRQIRRLTKLRDSAAARRVDPAGAATGTCYNHERVVNYQGRCPECEQAAVGVAASLERTPSGDLPSEADFELARLRKKFPGLALEVETK